MTKKKKEQSANAVVPAVKKRPLEIAFAGDVFTVFLEINSQEVTLHGDPGGGFKRTFDDFPPGTISVLLHVKGLNTTAWTLTMKYDGKSVLDEKGAIKGGFSHLVKSVTLA